jgi:hypothetical protein
MALHTLEKAPFDAIFHHVFDDSLRVFPGACPRGRKLARIRPRKALVLNHAQIPELNHAAIVSFNVPHLAVASRCAMIESTRGQPRGVVRPNDTCRAGVIDDSLERIR